MKDKLYILINSRTFTTLMLSNTKKTPYWRLHFSNVRFSGMTLEDVIEQAYERYDMINNIVR